MTCSFCLTELTIARHEVREVEQRHMQEAARDWTPPGESDDVVIIYNRVPKTASTSFTNMAYDLCSKNHFHVLHINTTKNNPVMSLQDQVRWSEGREQVREGRGMGKGRQTQDEVVEVGRCVLMSWW